MGWLPCCGYGSQCVSDNPLVASGERPANLCGTPESGRPQIVATTVVA